MGNKLYLSREWLRRKLWVEHKTPEEIAKECGTTKRTIDRAITKHGLRF